MGSADRLDEHWLNGFAFLFFRELPDGRWCASGGFQPGRIAPSVADAVRLRRRLAMVWVYAAGFTALLYWLLAGRGATTATVLLAFPLIHLLRQRALRRWSETAPGPEPAECSYQTRGWLVFLSLLAVGSSVPLLHLTLALDYPYSKVVLGSLSAALFLAGLSNFVVWRVVLRRHEGKS